MRSSLLKRRKFPPVEENIVQIETSLRKLHKDIAPQPNSGRGRYKIGALLIYITAFSYFSFRSLGGSDSSPRLRRSAANAVGSSLVDFTYGTILASRNAVGAYSQVESSVERNFHPLAHHGDSVAGIKVCIITDEYYGILPTGGIGHVLNELAHFLATHKAAVTLVYIGDNTVQESLIQDHASNGITFVIAPRPEIPIKPNHISLKYSYRALHFLMESEAKNELFDIIHFNDYFGHALFPLYAKKQGWLLASSKVVITLHGTGGWVRLANGMRLPRNLDDISLDWYEMQAISLADYICAPSKYIATYVVSRGTNIGGELFHIGNAPPSVQVETVANNTHKGVTKFSEVVFFGRLEYRKGPDLFIKALDLFAMSNPGVLENMKITFLGSTTKAGQKIVNQVHASSRHLSGLAFNFISSFDRGQAMAYIQHPSRLIVIPSLVENFPGTVFECIAVGASFIASDAGGIPEMIHPDDRNATLFRPLPEFLARKLSDKIMRTLPEFYRVRHSVLPTQIHSQILSFHNLVYSDLQRNVKLQESVFSPRVTVCMTHYERPLMLIESLKRMQLQTYSNFDLIVVDDGSKSVETLRILKESVAPLIHRYGWKLIQASHGYLGASRNICAQNTEPNVDYIFFIDEDDSIGPEALQVLVSTAKFTNADIVTSFFHYFKGANKETGKSVKVLMFSGGSFAMGILSNLFGGAMILISRVAFFGLGGFSEFYEVGHEDYELQMKAAINGLHCEIIPRDDLLYVRQREDSMSSTMDHPMAFFRSMSPLLNQYPQYADAFMILKGMN